MVQAVPQNNAERAAVDYLKRFIRGLDQSQLKAFLRYVTGDRCHLCQAHCCGVFDTGRPGEATHCSHLWVCFGTHIHI